MNKISLICASFNAGSTINRLLESIATQVYQNYELVIVDGGSTDNTLEIIRSYSFTSLKLVSEKDDGIYDAMNKGVNIATGDWLYFIGADDRIHDPHVLEKVVDFAKANPNADAIIGNVVMGLKEDIVFVPKYAAKLLFINSMHHQGIFYHKNVFQGFRYNSTFRISADYDLNLKLYLEKKVVVHVDTKISIVGEHGVSSKTSFTGYYEEMMIRKSRIKNKLYSSIINSFTLARYLTKKYFFRNSSGGAYDP